MSLLSCVNVQFKIQSITSPHDLRVTIFLSSPKWQDKRCLLSLPDPQLGTNQHPGYPGGSQRQIHEDPTTSHLLRGRPRSLHHRRFETLVLDFFSNVVCMAIKANFRFMSFSYTQVLCHLFRYIIQQNAICLGVWVVSVPSYILVLQNRRTLPRACCTMTSTASTGCNPKCISSLYRQNSIGEQLRG